MPRQNERGTGLRERKKAQTRRELRAGAARLFADQGFAGTTVADIAAAANVSERTFFRYFDSKEALLLPDGEELFARIGAELAARPPREEPVEAVCAALLAAAGPLAGGSAAAAAPAPPVPKVPAQPVPRSGRAAPAAVPSAPPVPAASAEPETAVSARAGVAVDRLLHAFDGFEERLTDLVAARLPERTPDRDLHAAVLACTCLSTVRAILRTRSARRAAGAAVAEPADMLAAALGVLSGIGSGAGGR
ncbi:TetR family transcriptional regulator [Streptomyces sp. PLK6-54]|uniref:TetR family transcriptional regulator n=1 Tax=Actinacidiphila acidipaludis TaxID=2873382 RepID=A0ABS7Q785_9ACTN|nr:TetR family transcriptional regulator [Streptomyces acidipaludis]